MDKHEHHGKNFRHPRKVQTSSVYLARSAVKLFKRFHCTGQQCDFDSKQSFPIEFNLSSICKVFYSSDAVNSVVVAILHLICSFFKLLLPRRRINNLMASILDLQLYSFCFSLIILLACTTFQSSPRHFSSRETFSQRTIFALEPSLRRLYYTSSVYVDNLYFCSLLSYI